MLHLKALQGYINPRFEWICPKCGATHFVDVLDFFKATAGGGGMKCDVCRIAYEVKIELLDPRRPTTRAVDEPDTTDALVHNIVSEIDERISLNSDDRQDISRILRERLSRN